MQFLCGRQDLRAYVGGEQVRGWFQKVPEGFAVLPRKERLAEVSPQRQRTQPSDFTRVPGWASIPYNPLQGLILGILAHSLLLAHL